MVNNYSREIGIADNMIRKFGSGAILRRAGGDRPCWAFISAYTPQERAGALMNPTDRRCLVSPVGLYIAPDSEQDRLVTLDPVSGAELETLRIMAPVGKLAPAGIVIYFELQLRR